MSTFRNLALNVTSFPLLHYWCHDTQILRLQHKVPSHPSNETLKVRGAGGGGGEAGQVGLESTLE